MVEDIRKEMDKSSYSCAIGMAIASKGEKMEDLMARADMLMYEDKMRVKNKK